MATKKASTKAPPDPVAKSFVMSWMDAYESGQNAAFLGMKLGIGRAVYFMARTARSKGIQLPPLWGERVGLDDQIEEINRYIKTRLDQCPEVRYRPAPKSKGKK